MDPTVLSGQLFDLIPAAAYVCEAPSGKIVRYNRRAVELWGREPQVGEDDERFCASFRLYRPDGTFISPGDSPIAEVLRTGVPVSNQEVVIERPDGSRIVALVNINPIRDAAGQVVAAVNVLQDITHQRRAEMRRAVEQTVARILAESGSVSAAAPLVLPPIAGLGNWDYGALWTVDQDQQVIRCAAEWNAPGRSFPELREINRTTFFRPGDGLPGLVWSRAEPVWLPDVTQIPTFTRLQAARREGLHAAFAFPAGVGKKVVGVLEFFSRDVREPDEDLKRSTAVLGNQIGQFLERKRIEELLRRDREWHHHVSEAAGEVFYDWNMIEDRGEWDGAMERVFGYPLAETGPEFAWWAERVHPHERDRVVAGIESWLKGERQYWQDEYRFRRADGSYAVVLDRGYAIRDEQGWAVRVLGSMLDITERKRVEEERTRLLQQEREARRRAEAERAEAEGLLNRLQRLQVVMRTALGHLPRAAVHAEILRCLCEVLAVDYATLFVREGDEMVAHASHGLEEEVEYRVRIPIGQGFAGRVAAERRLIVRNRIDPSQVASPVLREKGIRSAMGVPLIVENELIGVVSLGTLESREFSGEDQLLLQLVGEPVGLALSHSRLYAAERQARRRAEAAEQRVSLLAEAGRLLAPSLDYDATLERVARLPIPRLADWCLLDACEEDGSIRRIAVTHADPAEEELEKGLCRFPPDPASDHPAARVIRTGQPLLLTEHFETRLETVAPHPEHRQLIRQIAPTSLISVPLQARGRMLGALTLVSARTGRHYDREDLELAEDLARRAALALDNARLFQELQEADRNKDQFLAMLGHELRNPLGPILNAVHILELLGGDEPRRARAVETIKRQVRHQARLIDDLLNLTRVARGKLLLRFEPVELGELVGGVVEDHREPVRGAGLELRVTLPDEPVWVNADPTRLAQVVGNLLHNAVKFSEPGGRIDLRVSPSPNDHWATLSVRDTGVGIAPEVLPHIFEAFTQEDRSLDRTRGGLGLGLSLVKGLVELHGGEVFAASAGPGKGAEFSVRLPREPHPEAAPRRAAAAPATVGPLRVLVVEDNREAAETLGDVLELLGHESEIALTGPAGLEAARKSRPDVVLCDIGLPGMDGYEVARALRQDPGTGSALLVAVTGYGQLEDQQRAREAGFDHHLVKPVDPERLAELLGTFRRPD